MPEEEQQSRPPWWSVLWQRRWWIALATLFILIWWLVPPLLYRRPPADTPPGDKLKAITDTRTALLAGLIGVGALLTFWLNSRVYRITARTLEVTEQGHITERYTKAIEQLGSDKLDVRLGGIYALERLAQDSPQRDHPTVVEVLSAFVREGSRRHGTPPPKQGMPDEAAEKPNATAPGTDAKPQPATDIQAALTVLGRLPQQPNVSRGDLTGAQIAGAQLIEANLSGARLDRANLSGAQLIEANLSGARLIRANLSVARLRDADLTDAILYGADLTDAALDGAGLSSAVLAEADLSGAFLADVDMTDASLKDADLSGASLDGTDLRHAEGLTQPQLDAAQGDVRTQLPAPLERPASWAAAAPPASPGSPR